MNKKINRNTRKSLLKAFNDRNEDMEIRIREMKACIQLQWQATEDAGEIALHVEKLFPALHLNLNGADTRVSLSNVTDSFQSHALLSYDIDTAEDFTYVKQASGYGRASAKADRMARGLEKVIPEKFDASVSINPYSVMGDGHGAGGQVLIEIQFSITRK